MDASLQRRTTHVTDLTIIDLGDGMWRVKWTHIDAYHRRRGVMLDGADLGDLLQRAADDVQRDRAVRKRLKVV